MSSRQSHFYRFRPFCADASSRVLLRDGKALRLEPKVFDTLLVLIENHTRVVSKEELMRAVWGPDIFVEEGSLTRNISLLRKTLAEGLKGVPCIETYSKRGYHFAPQVSEVAGTSGPEPGAEALGHALAETGNGHPPGQSAQVGGAERHGPAKLLRRHAVAALAGMTVLVLAFGYWLARPLPAPLVLSHQALTRDGREKGGPLLTDGLRLFFQEVVDGKPVLAVMPSAEGSLSVFPLPSSNVSISDISPDGSDFVGHDLSLGYAHGKLLVWPVPSGAPEILLGLQGAWPTWSPDGARIAYSDGIHSLFVAGRHGENPRKVASVEGFPLRPLWSPDGRFLRFSQKDLQSEMTSLWEVPAAGGQPYPLFPEWMYWASDPAWTAGGSYFFFAAGPRERWDIWARRENCNPLRWRRREPLRITAGPLDYSAPLPSRDGRKLFVIGTQSRRELVRYDLKSKSFVPYLPALLAADPDFSPDGEWVAYARLPERILWRSRTDGTNAFPLTASGARVHSPHWSPDGKQIAYLTKSAQNQYKACVVLADGGQPQQLVPGAGEEGIPTWSRDGKFLAFGDVLHGRPASGMAIHLLDLRNHQVSTLPGSKGLWTPRWSPDGRYIAALALGDETKGSLVASPAVLLFDFQTHNWTTLARTANICNLTWSHDSQYVYFCAATSYAELYRVQVASKRVEPLASLTGLSALLDDWIGVAPGWFSPARHRHEYPGNLRLGRGVALGAGDLRSESVSESVDTFPPRVLA